ncbi:hypothetical protein K502DRAFT_296062 [Neoconidiobolus thromboides FSU 785]|nr:hypothetical protein K502DRAFT_296062 [Neoconidiobolus thromboides FSU 785]
MKDYKKINENEIVFISRNENKLKVTWLEDSIIRVQAVKKGKDFEELPLPITVAKDFKTPKIHSYNNGNWHEIQNQDSKHTLRVNYYPLRLQLIKGKDTIFEEAAPLELNDLGTVQLLKQREDEQFFGGGMQNGRFTHRNTKLNITVDYNWDDGGNPNPSPFYMSSKGYGVFRNTFTPGYYDFNSPLNLTHVEDRFDAYYFIGDYKQVLNRYTYLTGRPFMPPIYGLELGDSDCYSKTANGRPPKDTLIDSTKVADGYVQNDLPIGWMLVNDGYGCGYTQLDETNQALAKRNISLGLWTESNLTNQPTEVGKWGVRVRKLDVAWVGDGYEFGFKACNEAYNGIQDYSSARGFVWQVEGWAGVQKCAVQWTGDQSGSWENIRFHIPTIHGSGLSAQVYTAGDVDGIFRGSANTYIRDLQYKVFTPVFMTMSGWAKFDKQPWRYGEPGTSINRKYLKLREQLLPYIYTLAHEAHETGFPIVRSMVLEYPKDKNTWDKETTKYQYMFGSSFLVAPVYKDELKRDGIYLPEGKWIDYWNGKVYTGPTTLNGYNAPLDTLPLFVKENSIIPMWNKVNSYRERKPDHPIILDIYPSAGKSTKYTLYEDDLVTRQFQDKKYSKQEFSLEGKYNGFKLKIGEIKGSYDGIATERPYILVIHTTSAPKSVEFKGASKLESKPVTDKAADNKEGWYYDANDRSGALYVSVGKLKANQELDVQISL